MLESTLWKHLRQPMRRAGKFQKISDRFTPGIPDVLGCCGGIPMAMELKMFKGTHILRVKFRPGQLDWLQDWLQSGGVGLIVISQGQSVWIFDPKHGPRLESGVSPDFVKSESLAHFTKTPKNSWDVLVDEIRSFRNET